MKRRRGLLLTTAVVLALCGACGAWLRVQQQQYAHNRQLIYALENGDANAALALVNAGADPNTRQTPPPAPTFRLLFDHLLRRSPPPVNNSPTALMIACGALGNPAFVAGPPSLTVPENLPLLQAMLTHGANVNARALSKNTALHFACGRGRLPTMELLLTHSADVNAQDTWRHPTVMYAARKDVMATTRLLLSHNVNPNLQDVNGNAWLYYALFQRYPIGVIPLLMAHGADPNLPNKQGLTPRQYARKIGRLDLVGLLTRS